MAQQKEQQNASDKHKPGLASLPHSLTHKHTHTHTHTHAHAHAVLSWLFCALDKWFHGLLRLKLYHPPINTQQEVKLHKRKRSKTWSLNIAMAKLLLKNGKLIIIKIMSSSSRSP